MGLLVALVVGALALLYFTNRLTPAVLRLMGAGGLVLVAFQILRLGKPVIALLIGGVAAALALWKPRPATGGLGVDEARALLGVGPDASADDIRAAHRRVVTQVHPDKGGTAALAQRVNAARDLLLAELNRTPPRAS